MTPLPGPSFSLPCCRSTHRKKGPWAAAQEAARWPHPHPAPADTMDGGQRCQEHPAHRRSPVPGFSAGPRDRAPPARNRGRPGLADLPMEVLQRVHDLAPGALDGVSRYVQAAGGRRPCLRMVLEGGRSLAPDLSGDLRRRNVLVRVSSVYRWLDHADLWPILTGIAHTLNGYRTPEGAADPGRLVLTFVDHEHHWTEPSPLYRDPDPHGQHPMRLGRLASHLQLVGLQCPIAQLCPEGEEEGPVASLPNRRHGLSLFRCRWRMPRQRTGQNAPKIEGYYRRLLESVEDHLINWNFGGVRDAAGYTLDTLEIFVEALSQAKRLPRWVVWTSRASCITRLSEVYRLVVMLQRALRQPGHRTAGARCRHRAPRPTTTRIHLVVPPHDLRELDVRDEAPLDAQHAQWASRVPGRRGPLPTRRLTRSDHRLCLPRTIARAPGRGVRPRASPPAHPVRRPTPPRGWGVGATALRPRRVLRSAAPPAEPPRTRPPQRPHAAAVGRHRGARIFPRVSRPARPSTHPVHALRQLPAARRRPRRPPPGLRERGCGAPRRALAAHRRSVVHGARGAAPRLVVPALDVAAKGGRPPGGVIIVSRSPPTGPGSMPVDRTAAGPHPPPNARVVRASWPVSCGPDPPRTWPPSSSAAGPSGWWPGCAPAPGRPP